ILTISIPPGSQFFSVATANLGAASLMTVSVDTGSTSLPLTLTLCPSDSLALCLQPMAPSVIIDMPAASTATFIVQAVANGPIGLDPGNNRIFIRFVDNAGVLRAVTSVAVQSPAFAFTF